MVIGISLAGNELTALYAEIAAWEDQLRSLELGIRAAAQARDLTRLVDYLSKHAAIPSILQVLQRELNALRSSEHG